MKQKLLVIVGPTAVGKTALSIEMAKLFNGEIISGDSMQVYKQLDIGTAKITKDEQEGIVHHLIDVLEVDELYNASSFQKQATQAIGQIHANGHLPIIAGGTGLYIEGLINEMTFGGEDSFNPEIRQQLQAEYEEKGIEPLFERLRACDKQSAEKIGIHHHRRIIRALEVFMQTGEPMSNQSTQEGYDTFVIGLTCDRKELYSRINQRVDYMVANGLLDEARWLMAQNLDSDMTSMKAIGYKELFPYLRGELPLEVCVDTLKQQSRRYAKRQLTWFRNRMNVRWFDVLCDDKKELESEVSAWLNASF